MPNEGVVALVEHFGRRMSYGQNIQDCLYPTFRMVLTAESNFGVPLRVFYNLLTIRGDCYGRIIHVP
jgi:hypothetical protein